MSVDEQANNDTTGSVVPCPNPADHRKAQTVEARCCCKRGFHGHGGFWHDPAKSNIAIGGACAMCVEHNDDLPERLTNAVDRINELELKAQTVDELVKALEAMAKVQYDGTVEGLREQIRTEDWGDVLAVEEYRTAYELTLAALAQFHAATEEATR